MTVTRAARDRESAGCKPSCVSLRLGRRCALCGAMDPRAVTATAWPHHSGGWVVGFSLPRGEGVPAPCPKKGWVLWGTAQAAIAAAATVSWG